MKRTEVEFHLRSPCLLCSFSSFLYLDVECRVCVPYTWELFLHEMAAKWIIRRVDFAGQLRRVPGTKVVILESESKSEALEVCKSEPWRCVEGCEELRELGGPSLYKLGFADHDKFNPQGGVGVYLFTLKSWLSLSFTLNIDNG